MKEANGTRRNQAEQIVMSNPSVQVVGSTIVLESDGHRISLFYTSQQQARLMLSFSLYQLEEGTHEHH